MSYQVLAQKYRPQSFEDVAGQETVTRTLKNAVEKGRSANAYIFCGPRGVGKTSVARLLSKTLNCLADKGEKPCNKCASCHQISQGNDMDVLEIDGASNNGVDEIRALRENVKFSPSRGKYKIYIIDEVHMLSTGAFNALLKTLEEPPAHVKFIFATTEPHKVLPTIISRCQRFDFKRISSPVIAGRVRDIARAEKITLDEKAALLIARVADGSLRDALVVLDQMVSFSGGTIRTEDVAELMGMMHRDSLYGMADALIEGDAKKSAELADDMISGGKDPVYIANTLLAHFRDMMIIKVVKAPTSDMAFAEDELARIRDEAGKLSLEEILYMIQVLSHAISLMKSADFVRGPLEVALIKLANRSSVMSLPSIVEKIEELKSGMGVMSSAGSTHITRDNSVVPDKAEEASPSVPRGASMDVAEKVEERVPDGEPVVEELTDAGSKGHWKTVLNYVKGKKISLYTFLNPGKPIEFSDRKVVIGFDKEHSFNKEVLESESNKMLVQEAVNKVTGTAPALEFTILEFLGAEADRKDSKKERMEKAREEIKPVIEKAMDIFGGHIVRDFMEDV
ncbi:MAG: DNA polymerase III subunit gamma/tau [Candidatus Omnitrophica bacterium]|nr:DNA polymerase III subunit gamma/tau [Candidatus Omnitrophota bacterium]MDD5487795.1 DNA polymerase III subunit gamma/tau [Candidatus Omnitrophota bacterium]